MTAPPDAQVLATAPGRVCLFGEHLDYLGLPVIAAAIDLRMEARGRVREEPGWVIEKPDLGERDAFTLGEGELPYPHGSAADFPRAAVNVLRRHGVDLPRGAWFRITGRVPIQAGTSSSSALQVAWTAALLALAGDPRARNREEIGRLAHLSEVPEFRGAGGVMDQFTSAVGGLVRIDPARGNAVTRLPARLGRFVLGHSLEPKDTQRILSRVQAAARRGAAWLGQRLGHFSWLETSLAAAEDAARSAEDAVREDVGVALGALRNRDLLGEGHAVLATESADHRRLGALLSAHHAVLRDALRISTPKIERMLQAALEAGALGGKINGSGGGGCMFAYAPDSADAVAEALRKAGGAAWVVSVAEGVEITWEATPGDRAQSGE